MSKLNDKTAEDFRALLGRRRMTIRALSQQADMAYPTIYRKLTDPERVLTLDEVERIAIAFGLVARVELCAARDSNPEPADSGFGRSWSQRMAIAQLRPAGPVIIRVPGYPSDYELAA